MREIKFRAWDKEKKDWVKYFDYLINHNGEILMLFEGDWEVVKSERYILMQFTGLKDKNGKEIYEGDIIQVGLTMYEIAWYTMGGVFQPFTTSKTNSPKQ